MPMLHRRLTCLAVSLLVSAAIQAAGEPGFVSIFNGRDLSGWVVMGDQKGWRVEDGVIRSDGGMGGQWLRTERQYGDFILRLEWMLSEVGNSGILIRAGEKSAWGRGFEVQLLAPWTPHRDDLHCTASIYGYVAPDPRPDETPNRWRQMEIACRGKLITITLDGVQCVEVNMDEVPGLKDKALEGYIGLQDSHTGKGQWVKFRNIRVKDLDQDPDFIMAGLKSQDPDTRKRSEQAAARLGAPMVAPLGELLADDDPEHIRVAEGALFALVAEASAPENDAARSAVTRRLGEQLKRSPSERVRAYAARLLGIIGGGRDAVPRLAAALRDEQTRESARTALVRIPDKAATRALLKALGRAKPKDRPALIQALGARRDADAVKPLTRYARRGGRDDVRIAALDALGQIGGRRAVEPVAAAARKGSDEVRAAAVNALISLAEAQRGTSDALAVKLYHQALVNGVTGPQRSAALLGLSEAGDPELLPTLFSALRDDDIRVTAFRLLGQMKGEEVANAIAEELKDAQGWERAMLLRLSYEREAPGILDELMAAAKGDDEPTQTAALDILGQQPDRRYAPLFLAAAEKGSDAVKAAALRGYVAIADAAREEGDTDAALAMCHRTLELSADADVSRQALAGVAAIASPESLPVLDALVARGLLRDEAAQAYVAIADKLAEAGERERAIGIYTKVATMDPLVKAAPNAAARLRQLGVTKDLARDMGFVTQWWIIGPFPNPKQAAYERAYFPEKEIALEKEYEAEGKTLRWQFHRAADNVYGVTELNGVLGNLKDVACYAYAEVVSPAEQDALIKLGTDDGFVLWLNGQRLAGTPQPRALTLDQDVVKAKLRQGANRLLLKVLQGGSRWCFALRITDPEGRPLQLRERGVAPTK